MVVQDIIPIMDDLPKSIERELLHCKICEKRFSSMQLPKCLTLCSHTFCVVCINRNAVPSPHFGNSTSFTCPECKTVCQLPHGNAEFLQNNLTVMELTRMISAEDRFTSTQTERPPPYNPCNYADITSQSRSRQAGPVPLRTSQESSPSRAPHAKSSQVTLPDRGTPQKGKAPYAPPPRTVFKPGKRIAPPPPIPEVISQSEASAPDIMPDSPPCRSPLAHVSFNESSQMHRVSTVPEFTRSSDSSGAHYFSPQQQKSQRITSPQSRRRSAPSVMINPPVPPPRKDLGIMAPKLVSTFGKWSSFAMETSTFREPTNLAVSNHGRVAVVDSQGLTVQVFSSDGKYISMFKVIGITSVCFLAEERLVLGTVRGIRICDLAGKDCTKEIKIGKIISVCAFRFGFVAANAQAVLVYNHLGNLIKTIHNIKQKKKSIKLQKIQDVCANSSNQIAILDSQAKKIYTIDDNGILKETYDLKTILKSLKSFNIESITMDRHGTLYLSDSENHTIMKVNTKGIDSKAWLQFKSRGNQPSLSPRGLTMTSQDQIYVSLTAFQHAQISCYQIQHHV